jgi:hypothetical protein
MTRSDPPVLHITLRHLRTFEAVARHHSISRAASELHLTQPAVSMQTAVEKADVPLPCNIMSYGAVVYELLLVEFA